MGLHFLLSAFYNLLYIVNENITILVSDSSNYYVDMG